MEVSKEQQCLCEMGIRFFENRTCVEKMGVCFSNTSILVKQTSILHYRYPFRSLLLLTRKCFDTLVLKLVLAN